MLLSYPSSMLVRKLEVYLGQKYRVDLIRIRSFAISIFINPLVRSKCCAG